MPRSDQVVVNKFLTKITSNTLKNTAAALTKFNDGLANFQRRRRHTNSTQRIGKIRRRRGLIYVDWTFVLTPWTGQSTYVRVEGRVKACARCAACG